MTDRRDFRVLLAYGDLHRPYHDETAMSSLLSIITDLKPDILIDGGDMISADCLGMFKKGASDLVGLQNELDDDHEWRMAINSIIPNAEKVILKDNHFFRRLDDCKKDIHWAEDIRSLQPEALLRLDESKWIIKKAWKWRDSIMFIHGDEKGGFMASSDSPVNKVRRMVKNSKISIVRFHSHTSGFESHKSHTSTPYYAIQLGSFEDPHKAKYLEQPELSNWTTSACVFYLKMSETGVPLIFPVPIFFVDGHAIFNGKFY